MTDRASGGFRIEQETSPGAPLGMGRVLVHAQHIPVADTGNSDYPMPGSYGKRASRGVARRLGEEP